MVPCILIVDADRQRAADLSEILEPDYSCFAVHSADAALAALPRRGWFAVLADFDLDPTLSGIEFLQEVRNQDEQVLRVLYARACGPGLAREAHRNAHVHAVLGSDSDCFAPSLRRILKENRTSSHEIRSVAPGAGADSPEAKWCAVAPATQRFLEELKSAAEGECPVFIQGEEGSGKHLAVETLRYWRSRWRESRTGKGASLPCDAGEGPTAEAKEDRSRAVVLEVPPLRDRRQDIPHLAAAYLAEFSGTDRRPPGLSSEALAYLRRRAWWGNVEELHDVLLRAFRQAGARTTIEVSDLPAGRVPSPNPTLVAKDSGQRKAVLRHIRAAGTVKGAARRADLLRPNFMRIMKRLGILRADTAPQEEEGVT